MCELPRIRFTDVRQSGSVRLRELLLTEGAKLVTAEGLPVFVVMSEEQYCSLLAINPNPRRQPRMVRLSGVLYREVI